MALLGGLAARTGKQLLDGHDEVNSVREHDPIHEEAHITGICLRPHGTGHYDAATSADQDLNSVEP